MSTSNAPARQPGARSSALAASAGWAVPRMPARVRKTVLVLHVISSVGWLGLTMSNLILAITALTTTSPEIQHAVYRVAGLVGGVILVPISLTAFCTGLLLGLGTPWGLFRHRWVIVKLVLTLIAVVLTPLSLLPGIQGAVEVVSRTPADQLALTGRAASNLLAAACVSLTMYSTNVVLSIFKPWGRTRFGRRAAH